MSEEYEKLYEIFNDEDSNVRKDVIIAQINCIENEDICKDLNILSFPTLVFFNKNSKIPLTNFLDNRNHNVMFNWIIQIINNLGNDKNEEFLGDSEIEINSQNVDELDKEEKIKEEKNEEKKESFSYSENLKFGKYNKTIGILQEKIDNIKNRTIKKNEYKKIVSKNLKKNQLSEIKKLNFFILLVVIIFGMYFLFNLALKHLLKIKFGNYDFTKLVKNRNEKKN